MDIIKVSIVEDTHEIREGLKTILQGTDGFECVSAYDNAEDALQHLPADNPDVVIMDIQLPGMSGIECVTKLFGKELTAQVMMFTVYDDDKNIFDALKAGASGYMLKKTPPAKILEALTELMQGGSPMNMSIARRVISSFSKKTEAQKELDELTPRENEILQLLSRGLLYKEIAIKLHISEGTVRQHIHHVYEKLHVQNKTEAINKAFGTENRNRLSAIFSF